MTPVNPADCLLDWHVTGDLRDTDVTPVNPADCLFDWRVTGDLRDTDVAPVNPGDCQFDWHVTGDLRDTDVAPINPADCLFDWHVTGDLRDTDVTPVNPGDCLFDWHVTGDLRDTDVTPINPGDCQFGNVQVNAENGGYDNRTGQQDVRVDLPGGGSVSVPAGQELIYYEYEDGRVGYTLGNASTCEQAEWTPPPPPPPAPAAAQNAAAPNAAPAAPLPPYTPRSGMSEYESAQADIDDANAALQRVRKLQADGVPAAEIQAAYATYQHAHVTAQQAVNYYAETGPLSWFYAPGLASQVNQLPTSVDGISNQNEGQYASQLGGQLSDQGRSARSMAGGWNTVYNVTAATGYGMMGVGLGGLAGVGTGFLVGIAGADLGLGAGVTTFFGGLAAGAVGGQVGGAIGSNGGAGRPVDRLLRRRYIWWYRWRAGRRRGLQRDELGARSHHVHGGRIASPEPGPKGIPLFSGRGHG